MRLSAICFRQLLISNDLSIEQHILYTVKVESFGHVLFSVTSVGRNTYSKICPAEDRPLSVSRMLRPLYISSSATTTATTMIQVYTGCTDLHTSTRTPHSSSIRSHRHDLLLCTLLPRVHSNKRTTNSPE